jgi:hypothetical protein
MKKIIWLFILIIGLNWFHQANAQTLNLDLVWETDSYTPAEYLGKSLVAVGSTIRVTALSDTKNLEYWWRLDDYELPDYSGLNKNSFTFKATKISGQAHLVYLIVKSGGKNIASKTLEIPVVNPLIVFYEQDPILGETFNKSFAGAYQLAKPEITFVAEPFFFSRANVNNLQYTWLLNNQKVAADSGNGRVITFTTPASGGQGTNEIKLLAENPANALQYIQNSFSIIFNSTATNDATF